MLHGNADEPSSVINARIDNSDSRYETVHNSQIIPRLRTWPHAHFLSLRSCWEEGLSGKQSAARINQEFGTSYTRSGVIGKANREGLSAKGHRHGGRLKGCMGHRGARLPKAEHIPDITDFSIPFAQRKTFRQIESGDCKWPVGNPDEPDFFFCGGKSLEAAPYCAGHAKRACWHKHG